MTEKKRIKQIRIIFSQEEIDRIKTYAQKEDKSMSLWIEEAIKQRLSSGKFDRIYFEKGDIQLRISIQEEIIEQIEKTVNPQDIKLWIKETIYLKFREYEN